MSNLNSLIVRLSALLLLSGCCDNNDADCTKSELVSKKAAQAEWDTPALIAEKDGVKVYCIHCSSRDHVAYFTTPCGDTSWTEQDTTMSGKTPITDYMPKHITGQGCK